MVSKKNFVDTRAVRTKKIIDTSRSHKKNDDQDYHRSTFRRSHIFGIQGFLFVGASETHYPQWSLLITQGRLKLGYCSFP